MLSVPTRYTYEVDRQEVSLKIIKGPDHRVERIPTRARIDAIKPSNSPANLLVIPPATRFTISWATRIAIASSSKRRIAPKQPLAISYLQRCKPYHDSRIAVVNVVLETYNFLYNEG